jgi:hypothetical protein
MRLPLIARLFGRTLIWTRPIRDIGDPDGCGWRHYALAGPGRWEIR